jgi:hypothetical protein
MLSFTMYLISTYALYVAVRRRIQRTFSVDTVATLLGQEGDVRI